MDQRPAVQSFQTIVDGNAVQVEKEIQWNGCHWSYCGCGCGCFGFHPPSPERWPWGGGWGGGRRDRSTINSATWNVCVLNERVHPGSSPLSPPLHEEKMKEDSWSGVIPWSATKESPTITMTFYRDSSTTSPGKMCPLDLPRGGRLPRSRTIYYPFDPKRALLLEE